MSDYISHILEQSRGGAPSVQPLIAPMFAPPSFSAFISLEDLMQQQTSDSIPEGAPEAPYISSLALPDILAAQSSRAPMEVIEPQPQRVEETLSQPRLKAETWSEQPAISPLQPELAPPPRAVHIPAPPQKETPASDDVPSPQASLPAQPRAEKNSHKPAFLPGDLPAGLVPTTIVPAQPLTGPPTLEAISRDTAPREVSEEPPELTRVGFLETDSPARRGEGSGEGRGGPLWSPAVPLSPLPSVGASAERSEARLYASRPSPIMNFKNFMGVFPQGHESPVGADLSRPSPIYRPDGNPTTYSDYFVHQVSGVSPEPLSPHAPERGAPENQQQSERDELFSPPVSRPLPIMDFNKLSGISHSTDESAVGPDLSRPSPIYRPTGTPDYFVHLHYEHDGNLTPEPGAQQRPLARPHVDEARRSEPVIRVSIGRVEVRSTAPPAAPVMKRATPAAPALSLSDYLKRRKGETR